MKTKAEIVQRLLNEKQVDAEEAVILLMGSDKEVQFVPYYPNPSPQPINPLTPLWPQYPYYPITISYNSEDTSFN